MKKDHITPIEFHLKSMHRTILSIYGILSFILIGGLLLILSPTAEDKIEYAGYLTIAVFVFTIINETIDWFKLRKDKKNVRR